MEDSSLNFLRKTFELLNDGGVFDTKEQCDAEKSLVDFRHPHELKQLILFSLTDNIDTQHDDDEIEKLCRDVIKFSVKTNNRNCHNQLFGGLDFYGLAGEWMTSALNTGAYTFEMAPAFTLIEEAVIQKSLQLFGLDDGDGILCPGGSSAIMYGINLARYAKFPSSKLEGNPQGLVMFTSEDAHYSMIKGASFLGIGMQNLIAIKTNEFGQMNVDDLDMKINDAIKRNLKPFLVNATCGTTVLGAFDDLNKIADVCKKYNLWLHVDACLGGSAILSRKRRHLLSGSDRANSISWNPHKTMGVPLQCSIFMVYRKGILHECNSSSANYLFQQDKFYETAYDTGDKSLSCGRKVDAFKFWLMFKKHGERGFEKLIDNAFDMSLYFVDQIKNRDGFEVIFQPQYTNICFFYIPKFMQKKQERDEKFWECISKLAVYVKERMMKNGNLMIGYSPLSSKNLGNFFRMVVTCQPPATRESMDFVLEQIEKIAEDFEFYDK
ncbi:hypothetical protein PVAND_011089 [Polypedilum vanderplanki]|uniref:Uncharacterized protein n=1 Tax=Polypedilum vanderplanki TaxID=319348 RepID=A0A9J6CI22_POLVA|nr:hypothetical protein PVAND_011089 [Polypedilum vanderplanki]